jgi:type I restriction enzyme, S subunit
MTSDGWPLVRLGDFVQVIHGFAFKTRYANEEPSPYALFTRKNVALGGGFREDGPRYYHGDFDERFLLDPGDLMLVLTDLSKDGDLLGLPAIVPFSADVRYLHNQRVGKVLVVKDGIDEGFLYALFRSPEYRRHVLNTASQTTVRDTAPSRLHEYRFRLPPLNEQKRIASTFRALDDKIDSNRRLAALLEQASAVLFRARFLDFLGVAEFQDSEIGAIPHGWRVGSVYDLASVTYGAPFKSALFSENDDGLPLLRIRDLGKDEPGIRTPEQRSDARLVRPGDIVVGMDGEFRAHLWHGPPSWLNQRVCVFDPLPEVSRAFVFHAIKKPLAFFEATKQGTTVIHLGKRDIDTFRVAVPDAAAMDDFTADADPLLDKAVRLRAECRALTQLRDALLPRIISGAIRVSETVDSEETTHRAAEEVPA